LGQLTCAWPSTPQPTHHRGRKPDRPVRRAAAQTGVALRGPLRLRRVRV